MPQPFWLGFFCAYIIHTYYKKSENKERLVVKIFFAFKLRRKMLWVLLGLAAFILYFCTLERQGEPVSSTLAVLPLTDRIIGVDPGHGGYDPGAGQGDIIEKDVVLQIGLYLRQFLHQAGAQVVMTREEDYDLLELPVGPKKRADMANRLIILEEAGTELVVCIHANYIASPRWHGAQTFYRADCANSRHLSRMIQEELIRVLQNTNRQTAASNFFIMNETTATAALVEVGFLSNPKEAMLLTCQKKKKKVAWAVYLGIVRHYSELM